MLGAGPLVLRRLPDGLAARRGHGVRGDVVCGAGSWGRSSWIDAAHADRRVARGGARWRTAGGLGRRSGAVEAVPSTAAPIVADLASRAPELQYQVRLSLFLRGTPGLQPWEEPHPRVRGAERRGTRACLAAKRLSIVSGGAGTASMWWRVHSVG
ncbi:hypothetical protein OG241_19915 [Streptomyces sp. NBC_01390]|uniref:hypothetical protein n=1 Tax=Streptomyces sp. NBC_01390 TaxID=2903850 RepID=UPI003247E070